MPGSDWNFYSAVLVEVRGEIEKEKEKEKEKERERGLCR